MSMVVLGTKTRAHKWRKERAAGLQKTGTGGAFYWASRPAWVDRPRVVPPPGSAVSPSTIISPS
jgi:hypothetical protein